MHLGVSLQKLGDPVGLVRREVVRNHMNRFARGLVGHEVGQERDELLRGMPGGCLAQHLAGFGHEALCSKLRGASFGVFRLFSPACAHPFGRTVHFGEPRLHMVRTIRLEHPVEYVSRVHDISAIEVPLGLS